MRIWSFHPQHLNSQYMVQIWRESLLAMKALTTKNKRGYYMHPQLNRFKNHGEDALQVLSDYMWEIWKEADRREFHFDQSKLMPESKCPELIKVNQGQILYEWSWYCKKVKQDGSTVKVIPHPMILVVDNLDTEKWEKVK